MNYVSKIAPFASLLLCFLLISCSNPEQQQKEALEKLDVMLNELTDEATGRIKTEEAKTYIGAIEQFAAAHPEATESPKQLYKAAEVARSVQDYNKALALYAQLEAEFPQYEKTPKALFMQAFTYAEDLGNDEKAKELYEAFIAKYPNDDFVDDAQILLQTMGKTDEEIFEALGKEQ